MSIPGGSGGYSSPYGGGDPEGIEDSADLDESDVPDRDPYPGGSSSAHTIISGRNEASSDTTIEEETVVETGDGDTSAGSGGSDTQMPWQNGTPGDDNEPDSPVPEDPDLVDDQVDRMPTVDGDDDNRGRDSWIYAGLVAVLALVVGGGLAVGGS